MHTTTAGPVYLTPHEAELTKESHVKHNASIDAMLAGLIGDNAEALLSTIRALPKAPGGARDDALQGCQTDSGVMVSRAKAREFCDRERAIPSIPST
jgi:cation transport regulator ChaC